MPLLALALVRRVPGAVPLAFTWNVLGLFDLVAAVGMGTGFLTPFLVPELAPGCRPAADGSVVLHGSRICAGTTSWVLRPRSAARGAASSPSSWRH